MIKNRKLFVLKKTSFIVIICSVFFFFFLYRTLSKTSGSLETAASYLLYPLLVTKQKIASPFIYVADLFTSQKALREKIALLEHEQLVLQEQLAMVYESQEYLKQVQALERFAQKYEVSAMHLGQIIAKQFTHKEHTFLVDRGSKHGITKDMVAVYKKHILGKVDQVYPYYSKVIALTDARCHVSAYSSQSKTQGIFQGGNTFDSAHLQHVDRLKKIKKGEWLISTGQGTRFPRGFTLGKVESVTPEGLHYNVQVTPLITLESLEYCYIIHKGELDS